MIINGLKHLESIDDTFSVIVGTISAEFSGYLANIFSNIYSGNSKITVTEGNHSTSVSSANGDTIKISISAQGEGEAAGDCERWGFTSSQVLFLMFFEQED